MVMRVLVQKGIQIWNLCGKLSNQKVFFGFRGFLGLNSKIYIKRTIEITAKEKIRELQRHEAER